MENNKMDNTGSRSGYDSTAEDAQGKTRKATGALSKDMQAQREGEMQEASAQAKEDKILEPWERTQSAAELNDEAGK